MSDKRVVHYAAVGRNGLVFDCFLAEYARHEASGDPTANEHNRWLTRTVPAPERRTDLRKVTCPACWKAIAVLAANRNPTSVAEAAAQAARAREMVARLAARQQGAK